tara:strand:+ start:3307 stop:4662 length:1356 start_codon:yes stop_codon:yes gene_type:complete
LNKKFFGTDGIRGTVNESYLTADTALKLGIAAGKVFTRGPHIHRVVIGKDTRVSGYMLETALTSGFTSVGMDVFLFGPIPTPAVAFLTQALRADIGVMITASHNTFEDNGFKLFGPDGYKLSDEKELEIENLILSKDLLKFPRSEYIGRAKRIDDAQARYIEYAKRSFPKEKTLENIKIVLDCANGASYKVAPETFWELGAQVTVIGNQPNGKNINLKCGSTNTDLLKKTVIEKNADIGIALDGDADRMIVVDEKGKEVDGDLLFASIINNWNDRGMLANKSVASTIMANFALEKYLSSIGINLIRTNVGDRHLVKSMKDNNLVIGGEPSGHIVMRNFGTTGDGLIASLQVLSMMSYEDRPISELTNLFELYPQKNIAIPINNKNPLNDPVVKKVIKEQVLSLADNGRIIVRKSGTEPIIRVMVESKKEIIINDICKNIVSTIEKSIKSNN